MKIIKTFEEFVKTINEERENRINEIADWDTRKIIKDKEKAFDYFSIETR